MSRQYGISVPLRNINSLQRVAAQLKEAVEFLLGQRGSLQEDADVGVGVAPPTSPPPDETGATAYAIGFTNNVQNYNPGVTTPTQATRIPLQTTTKSLNVTMQPFAFQPLQDGDYYADCRLTFSPNGLNEIWYAAIFQNDVQISVTLEINNESLTERYVSLLAGVIVTANDLIDFRLWPQNDTDTGTITLCEFFLGGIQTKPAEELPGSDHEQRITNLENQMALIVPQLNTHTSQITTLQAEQVTQDSRLDAIEAEQDIQNNRLDATEHNQGEIVDAINFLLDGTHAFGYVETRYRHSPANNGNNTNTRITFDTTTTLSNVSQVGNYGFTPQYEGDYHIIAHLNFEADSSGDEWRMRAYNNNVPFGDEFRFKPDEVGGGVFALFTLQTAGHFVPGDVIDLRLWPKDSGKRGWIESYSYQFTGLGLIDPDWQPTI